MKYSSAVKTSVSSPLRVDFVGAPVPGRLGLTIAPGKVDPGRGWQRELGADLERLCGHYGADRLVSLMEPFEYDMLGIADLFDRAQHLGLPVVRFPIKDVSVPREDELEAFGSLVSDIVAGLGRGETIVVHCRGGIGRSGTVAAAALVALGQSPGDAIRSVRAARPGAVETRAQEQWVERYAASRRACAPTQAGRAPGCLLGGALGDALGYPVEFDRDTHAILRRHGECAPERLTYKGGSVGRISDDTQMTLFTAEALVLARESGEGAVVEGARAYLRWLSTQTGSQTRDDRGWLVGDRRLHSQRAPGGTCMSALRSLDRTVAAGEAIADVIPTPRRRINDSKGCGAVMRVAPVGLVADTREQAFELARDFGAITHSHASGYLSGAYLAALVFDLVRGTSLTDAMAAADALLAAERENEEMVAIVARARELAARRVPITEGIEALGEGWVGEEALAIALFVALRADLAAPRGFEDALWLAAAHKGDSDSTAAIAGNLLGAIVGADALPASWLDDLELADVIRDTAGRLRPTTVEAAL